MTNETDGLFPPTGECERREREDVEWRERMQHIADGGVGMVTKADIDRLTRERDEARVRVNQWVTAALNSTMPDEFGLTFDPTDPAGWAMSRRATVERALNERDAAVARLARFEALARDAEALRKKHRGHMAECDLTHLLTAAVALIDRLAALAGPEGA